jgi:hypothetical protein
MNSITNYELRITNYELKEIFLRLCGFAALREFLLFFAY